MKKFFALFLAMVMLVAFAAPAFAQKADLSSVYASPNLFEVEMIDGAAYVTTTLPMSNRSFEHKYESEYQYSGTEFLLLIMRYGESGEQGAYTLRIFYSTEQGYQNIDSVSFIVGGKEYRFNDVLQVRQDFDGTTYTEMVAISFGLENMEFLVAMEEQVKIAEATGDRLEWFRANPIPIILHGKEDISSELGAGFYLDFMATKTAVLECVDIAVLTDALFPTELVVTDAK